jgi:hypothetical protein
MTCINDDHKRPRLQKGISQPRPVPAAHHIPHRPPTPTPPRITTSCHQLFRDPLPSSTYQGGTERLTPLPCTLLWQRRRTTPPRRRRRAIPPLRDNPGRAIRSSRRTSIGISGPPVTLQVRLDPGSADRTRSLGAQAVHGDQNERSWRKSCRHNVHRHRWSFDDCSAPPPPTSQSTASAGPPSMWDSHGHAHTSGPHGGVCEREE